MPKFKVTLFVLPVLVLLFSEPASGFVLFGKGETQEVFAEGMVRIGSKDEDSARALALFDAQRNAVLKMAKLFCGSSFDKSRSKIESSLLKTPQKYIKKHHIVEAQRLGEYYKTRIKAYLLTDKLGRDIKPFFVSAALKKIKILLISRQSSDGKESMDGIVADAFEEEAQKGQSFDFLKTSTEMKEEFFSSDVMQYNLSHNSGADILILLEAKAERIDTLNSSNFYPFQGNIDFKAVNIRTGELIKTGSLKTNIIVPKEEKGERRIFTVLGKSAASKFMPALKNVSISKTTVVLKLKRLSDYEKLKSFFNYTMALEKVFDMKLASWRGDEATFEMDTSMSPEEVASSVLRKNIFPVAFEKTEKNLVIMKFLK